MCLPQFTGYSEQIKVDLQIWLEGTAIYFIAHFIEQLSKSRDWTGCFSTVSQSGEL